MTERDIDLDFGEMWGHRIQEFALIKSATSPLRYTIMDTVHNGMVIIEDDSVARYVIERMLSHGVRIANTEDEVRNPNPPERIFFTPELDAKFRAMLEQKNKRKRR